MVSNANVRHESNHPQSCECNEDRELDMEAFQRVGGKVYQLVRFVHESHQVLFWPARLDERDESCAYAISFYCVFIKLFLVGFSTREISTL